MTDEDKIHIGFDRRMNKTRRNFRRMALVARSVNRNQLTENDARAHDSHLSNIALLGAAFIEIPDSGNSLKLTIEVDRELPRLNKG